VNPFRIAEIFFQLLESTLASTCAPFATLFAAERVLPALPPYLFVEVLFWQPLFTLGALLAMPVAGEHPFAVFAKASPVLFLPLRFREFCFELLRITATAHMRRHVLGLYRGPIYDFSAQDSQQQVRSFLIALVEEFAIEGPEYQ
jgi:hypothetical protein